MSKKGNIKEIGRLKIFVSVQKYENYFFNKKIIK